MKYNSNKTRAILVEENRDTLYSYNTLIARVDRENMEIILYKAWDYSPTTRKHRYYFFNEHMNMGDIASASDLKQAIKDGFVEIGNVNYKVVMA